MTHASTHALKNLHGYYGMGQVREEARTSQDATPFLRQLAHRYFVRKNLRSSAVQYDLVTQAHVRSFHTSRTAFAVMPCFSASTALKVSLPHAPQNKSAVSDGLAVVASRLVTYMHTDPEQRKIAA